MLAARNARLVIHNGTERLDVRKSSLVATLVFSHQPMPRTKTKYRAMIA